MSILDDYQATGRIGVSVETYEELAIRHVKALEAVTLNVVHSNGEIYVYGKIRVGAESVNDASMCRRQRHDWGVVLRLIVVYCIPTAADVDFHVKSISPKSSILHITEAFCDI